MSTDPTTTEYNEPPVTELLGSNSIYINDSRFDKI